MPDGIDIGCTDAVEPGSRASAYDGANYADCTAFVGDTTVVYLSSVAPDASAATAGAADGITEWFETVTAPAS